jgi:hypothetical protein
MTIHESMLGIMRDVEGLTKDRTSQGGFKYRGIDDMYNYLHDVFVKHGVFSVPRVITHEREERKSSQGKTLIYTLLTVEYTFFATDGSFVTSTVIGEAFDTGDKSASKALAIAHKYALFQVTMLPTLLPDPDAEVHQVENTGGSEPGPAQAIPMASKGQHATLADYRKLGATTGEMNEYLDQKGDSLTAKQASQLINKIEAEMPKEQE